MWQTLVRTPHWSFLGFPYTTIADASSCHMQYMLFWMTQCYTLWNDNCSDDVLTATNQGVFTGRIYLSCELHELQYSLEKMDVVRVPSSLIINKTDQEVVPAEPKLLPVLGYQLFPLTLQNRKGEAKMEWKDTCLEVSLYHPW